MADYKEAPLASQSLNPNEYFNVSKEKRRADIERAALRADLKKQYQIQLNNPHREGLIDDPALTRWVHARNNPYPYFRPTFKTSLLGALFGIVPLVIMCYSFKAVRDSREEEIKNGTLKRKFHLLA